MFSSLLLHRLFELSETEEVHLEITARLIFHETKTQIMMCISCKSIRSIINTLHSSPRFCPLPQKLRWSHDLQVILINFLSVQLHVCVPLHIVIVVIVVIVDIYCILTMRVDWTWVKMKLEIKEQKSHYNKAPDRNLHLHTSIYIIWSQTSRVWDQNCEWKWNWI